MGLGKTYQIVVFLNYLLRQSKYKGDDGKRVLIVAPTILLDNWDGEIKKFIQQVNSNLPSYETIKKFEIIMEPWTTENGFLTPSLKVKRKLLEKKYSELINKLYQ